MAHEEKIQEMVDAVVAAVIFLFPSAIASLIMSFSDYLERHYGKDPFDLAILLVGLFTDMIYGIILAATYWGAGGRSFLMAIAVSCIGVHFGIRSMEELLNKLVMKKYGIKLEMKREDSNVENCPGRCSDCPKKESDKDG